MKKTYSKPAFEITEFRFSEHIATSGEINSCYWGSNAYWTHGFVGCDTMYHAGTGGWVSLNG